MKVRNKLTGEINILKVDEDYFKIYKDDGEFVCPVTLKELNAGWEEYYEEPKEYWYIDYDGGILCGESDNSSAEKMMISMGNHFKSLEEAEKAVEKLKAFANLRKRGLKFNGWDEADRGMVGEFAIYCDVLELDGIERELEIVFGREEL